MPKTITSALEWNGVKGDWSTFYRLFSKTEWNVRDLFGTILADAVSQDPSGTVYAAMDDTLVRKTGKRFPGTAYARDPLSPPFRANLVLGQRFLQTTVMARAGLDGPWRSIPVSFRHAPPLKAPANASTEERQAVKEARKKKRQSATGVAQSKALRARASWRRLPSSTRFR